MIDRADSIIRHFDYLVSKFGFHVEQREFSLDAMGNAFVVFKSPEIGIEIVIDRNQVLIKIGDQLDTKRDWFEFSNVLRYFAPSVKSAYVFPEKTESRNWDEAVEIQLNRLSEILLQYCEPILRGDLSGKEKIRKAEKVRENELIEQFNSPSKHLKNRDI